ncbi:MAG: alpha/beta hydrolase [Anaerolineales bacterium]|nr:alpha/beta hydrolase [Anaerolineales bacterium]
MRRQILQAVLAVILFVTLGVPFLIPLDDTGLQPATDLADPAGRFIAVAGLQAYVLERGPVDGTPVVFVHGLFGSTFSWRYNLDAVAEAGYRAIAYDRPGAGLTEPRADFDYSVASQADFLAALLDRLGIGQARFVAHSAGAVVLAEFALRYPERIERQVIVDGAILAGAPPVDIGPLVAFAPINRWGRLALRTFVTPAAVASVARGLQADPGFWTEADDAGYGNAMRMRDWDVGFLGLVRDRGRTPQPTEAQLRTITAPTLLLWGEVDTATPLAQGEQLAAWLPNAQLIVYPGVGHQPFEEAAVDFNRDVLAFMRD